MTKQYSKSDERKLHRKELSDARMSVAIWSDRVSECERISERIVADSDLGERFSMRTFDTFDQSKQQRAYDIARKYVQVYHSPIMKGVGLVFTGNTGTGKTHLAAAIANDLIRRYRIRVRFINYVELLDEINKSFNGNEPILDKFKRAELLILDDIGREKVTDFTNKTLYSIINYRYEHLLPTIITSNYRASELASRVGAATVSRISEICRGVQINGADYRIER